MSATPSPFGEMDAGVARTALIASCVAFAPSVPVAGRSVASPPIVQRYAPGGVAVASQVQSTVGPMPLPEATVAPTVSVTVTVHGRAAESRAVNRIGPPMRPVTTGA